MPNRDCIRHGDLLFIPIPALPGGSKLIENSDGILAEGEATGHHHRVVTEDLANVEVYNVGWNKSPAVLRVNAEGGISIDHEEHGLRVIPYGPCEGLYGIHRARTWDYFQGLAASVRD